MDKLLWNLSRREFLKLSAIAGVAALPVACAASAPAVSQRPAQVLSWPDVGIAEPPTLDPARVTDKNSQQVIDLVFSGLVGLDKDLKPVPDAAEKWDISGDGLTYTFHLRDGLAFSDGTPVAAEDFVYSLTRALSPALKSPAAAIYLNDIAGAQDLLKGTTNTLAGVTAKNARTLEIRLSSPIGYFIQKLTYPTSYVVSQKIVEQYGDTWTDHALGTGPFALKEWNHRQSITLVPNTRWSGGRAQLTQLTIPFVVDPVTAWRQYQAGELDIVQQIPSGNYDEAKSSKDYRDVLALYTDHLKFNLKAAPFQDRDVRRAFAFALDRTTLAEKVMADTVKPATTLLPPGMPGYSSSTKGLAFDPAKAQAALAAAGFPGGKGLPPIRLTVSSGSDNQKVAAAIQQMWQTNIGVRVDINQVEFGTLLKGMQQGSWQVWRVSWTADFPDPSNLLSVMLTTKGARNRQFYSNPAFDSLVERADHMLNNNAERFKLYQEAEQIAVDDVPVIPLDWPKFSWLTRSKVKGFAYTAAGIVPRPAWTDVSIVG